MNSQSFISDAEDSSTIFRSSIIPKRKATDSLGMKTLKQSKLFKGDSHALTSARSKDDNLELELSSALKNKNIEIWNETHSTYFESNKILKKKCPLCQNSLESDTTHTDHLKHCTQKHKMSTNKLLNVLENQKKQMKKLVANDLSVEPKLTLRETIGQKDLVADYDIALGIALSKSIKENFQNASVGCEMKKPLTKSGLSVLNSLVRTSPRKKKNKKNKIYVLSNRTPEERQNIITEKAALILLDENHDNQSTPQKLFSLKSDDSKPLKNQVCRLWSLSENERNFGWYVEQLKNLIKQDVGEEEKDDVRTQNACFAESDALSSEVKNLNLPKTTLYEDWRKMINSENFSDLIATSRDRKIIYLHSLILHVRCPSIFETNWKSVFDNFSSSTILTFIEYIYCGTLNSLKQTDLQNLINLTTQLNYQELEEVLTSLDFNVCEDNEEIIPSSVSPRCSVLDISTNFNIQESNSSKEEDKDLFEENVMQNSETSSTVDSEQDKSNLQKSYWSFIQSEKRKEHQLKKEECSLTVSWELGIEFDPDNDKKSSCDEFKVKDAEKDNQIVRVERRQSQKSDDSATTDLDEEFLSKRKISDNIIVISSDSESHESKFQDLGKRPEETELETASQNWDCDVPYFDPYENYNHLSDCNFSPVDLHSQSLIAEEVSKYDAIHLEETITVEEKFKLGTDTTPVSFRTSLRTGSSEKCAKIRKRRSDLSASRILRKSLHLSLKSPKPSTSRQSSVQKVKMKTNEDEDWFNQLTNSLVQEFGESSTIQSSTPVQSSASNTRYVEMTPGTTRDAEIEESVTPYPNYSRMEEGLLKASNETNFTLALVKKNREHLAKYGLKKNLGKRKAQKILKHLYEELHPYINKKTGKLVKRVITETPKNHKKLKSKSGPKKGKKLVENAEFQKNTQKRNRSLEKRNVQEEENTSMETSNGSDYDDLTEVLTQSVPSNPKDLPLAMVEFLRLNPEFHEKILTYEPIWVRDLQLKLKDTFKKHYKMEDLVNYLDQKCITFRTKSHTFQKNKKQQSVK